MVPLLFQLEEEATAGEVEARPRHSSTGGMVVGAQRNNGLATLGLEAPHRHREVAERVVREEVVSSDAALEQVNQLGRQGAQVGDAVGRDPEFR